MNWLTFKELCLKCRLKSTIMYRLVYDPDFPKARNITGTQKGRLWNSDEIDAWINSKAVGDVGGSGIKVA